MEVSPLLFVSFLPTCLVIAKKDLLLFLLKLGKDDASGAGDKEDDIAGDDAGEDDMGRRMTMRRTMRRTGRSKDRAGRVTTRRRSPEQGGQQQGRG